MLKRENRLLPGIRFNNSFTVSVPEFVLKKKENELLINRFGIVVSKKIDKRAVIRNKIKRMLRTILIDLNEKMIPGHDILFIVKPAILSKTKEENYLIVKSALKKIGLLKIKDKK